MSELFIVHTQYNLILATGIASCDSDLILFEDFLLTKELKKKLCTVFRKCLFLDGNYPKQELSALEKKKKINSACIQIKQFIENTYEKIVIVEDMCIPEMYALKCAYLKNSSIEMVWLEDGSNAYFSNNVISGGMGGTPLKRMIRKSYFSFKYGLWGFYDLAVCMGSHKRLTKAYLTFPGHARQELAAKEQVAIAEEQFRKGLSTIYAGEPIDMHDDCVLIAVDKLDVYGDKLETVNAEVQKVVNQVIQEKKKLYCKYHPRETSKLPALQQVEELNSKIAMEYYMINTTATHMTVVGVMSTALQTAKKLGFSVVSIADKIGGQPETIEFYKKIGIQFE